MKIFKRLTISRVSKFFFCFIFLFAYRSSIAQICNKPFHIVVLGSSTAVGEGASDYERSWSYKYEDYLKAIDTNYVFVNLAVSGSTTYIAQPTSYQPPVGRPAPMQGHNITAALDLHPDAIIINYPTNDAVQGYTFKEQKDNFKRITDSANKANVLVWVATTQPRNNLTDAQLKRQKELFTWIESFYKEKAIDFYTGLASNKDSILYKFDSGDGIHLNNRGHKILYDRVVAQNIPDTLCLRNPAFVKTVKPCY